MHAENSIMLTYNKLKYKLQGIKNHLDFADQQTLMCVYCVDSIQLHCKTQIEFIFYNYFILETYLENCYRKAKKIFL